MAAHMALKIEQKQEILEIIDLQARVEHVLALLDAEIDLLQVEKRIRGRVKKQMERSQREYYLNEQMKAIQKELGDGDEGHNEIEELKKRIDAAGLPKDAMAKAQAELNKLKQNVANVRRSHRGALLHRLAGAGAVEGSEQGAPGSQAC
jgi:ATP-dependent Lon protease, bacterial type